MDGSIATNEQGLAMGWNRSRSSPNKSLIEKLKIMKMKKDDIYSSAGTEVESSTTADNLQVSQPIAKHNVMGRLSVTRENTEIFDQIHQMYAEGTSDVEPLEKDIQLLLSGEIWIADEIDIWFDNMQGFWRWWCSIERAS